MKVFVKDLDRLGQPDGASEWFQVSESRHRPDTNFIGQVIAITSLRPPIHEEGIIRIENDFGKQQEKKKEWTATNIVLQNNVRIQSRSKVLSRAKYPLDSGGRS